MLFYGLAFSTGSSPRNFSADALAMYNKLILTLTFHDKTS